MEEPPPSPPAPPPLPDGGGGRAQGAAEESVPQGGAHWELCSPPGKHFRGNRRHSGRREGRTKLTQRV